MCLTIIPFPKIFFKENNVYVEEINLFGEDKSSYQP